MSHNVLKTEVIIPRLPQPGPGGITQSYVDQLVAAMEQAIDVLNSTRQRSFTEINLTNTQEHGGLLRVGDVFSDSGILKIVRTGDVFAAPSVGTMSLGTVSVTTT